MKNAELSHLLRSIDEATGQEHRFLLIGSQAILAHLSSEHFEIEDLFTSSEIDIVVLDQDSSEHSATVNLIDGAFGEFTYFHQTYNYFADPVDIETAVLAPGWESRLKRYESGDVREGVYFALSYADLLSSKLYAGREKDLAFVRGMCETQHPELGQVAELLNNFPEGPRRELARQRWSSICREPTCDPSRSLRKERGSGHSV